MTERVNLEDLLKQIPGPATAAWPDGEPFADGISHGTMSVELFSPRGRDFQQPHDQDELYIVVAGRAQFTHNGETSKVRNGDVLFVPAGDSHNFDRMTPDFLTWVVFWGRKGGE